MKELLKAAMTTSTISTPDATVTKHADPPVLPPLTIDLLGMTPQTCTSQLPANEGDSGGRIDGGIEGVMELLRSLGLEDYCDNFRRERVSKLTINHLSIHVTSHLSICVTCPSVSPVHPCCLSIHVTCPSMSPVHPCHLSPVHLCHSRLRWMY